MDKQQYFDYIIGQMKDWDSAKQIRELQYQIQTHKAANMGDFKKARRSLASRKRWMTDDEYNEALANIEWHDGVSQMFEGKIKQLLTD